MEIIVGEDGKARCSWGVSAPEYVAYHDHEWGYPVKDDQRLFEKLTLEGFQSGLSWLTILRKRPAFRAAFHDFEIERVAAMTEDDVTRLLGDAAIVRHRGKIESTINNAQRTLELQDRHGSLAAFVWPFEPIQPSPDDNLMEAQALAKALKQSGFTFVGPTTVYAFMQAMGLVNDHLDGCYVRAEVDGARQQFARPE